MPSLNLLPSLTPLSSACPLSICCPVLPLFPLHALSQFEGATLLLAAHYQRLEGGDVARSEVRLRRLMDEMKAQCMTVSFEMVTGKRDE